MKINLPLIVSAEDYHEFDEHLKLLNKVLLPDNPLDKKEKLKEFELGNYGSLYHAVIHTGEAPTDVEILKLIAKDEKLKTGKAIKSFLLSYEECFPEVSLKDLTQAIDELKKEGYILPPKPKKKLVTP